MKSKFIMLAIILAVIGGISALVWEYFLQHNAIGVAVELQPSASHASLGSEYRVFEHPKLGFSVEYPAELSATRYEEGEGAETILFENEKEGEEKLGFQIFITPFEEEKITREKILQDLPNADVEEPQEAILGDGTHALIFWSNDPTIGRTREVWFSHAGYLYEVSTYAHLDTWLAHLMTTWRFSK